MTVLVDSGSSHSFLNPQIMKLLRIQPTPITIPMKIVVANEEVLYCDSYYPEFLWSMQEEIFSFNMRIVHVGGCDLVLGWIR